MSERSAPASVMPTASTRTKSRERIGWIVATIALMLTLGLAVTYFRRAQVEVRPVRSLIPLPENSRHPTPHGAGGPVISPDGTRLAFVAVTEGKRQLWVRSLDANSAQALAGTEGAQSPFWSPDGRSIGFFVNQKLKKIEASGGPQITLCDVESQSRGGAWNRDGVIIFAPSAQGPLYRVPASGGTLSPVTRLDAARGELGHLWPYFFPDGQHFLYLCKRGAGVPTEEDAIYVGSLDLKESKPVVQATSNAAYAQGYLLFVREATLMAQLFDAKRMETAGDPLLIAEQIRYSPVGNASFSVCENGVLAYVTEPLSVSQLTWFDRNGKPIGTLGDQVHQSDPHLSPDGKTAVVTILDSKTRNRDLWLYELARGLRTRLTFDPADDREPVWSPDGSRIVFQSNRKGHWDLYQKASTAAGREELLLESSVFKVPFSWSPNGRFLLYRPFYPKTGWDL